MVNLFFKSTIPLALYTGATKTQDFITKTYRSIARKITKSTPKKVEIDPTIRNYKNIDQMNRIALKYRSKIDFKASHDPAALLELRHVKKSFRLKKPLFDVSEREFIAVDDVSFKLRPGETLGIIGESGSGKSALGRTILKHHNPTSGQIIFDGDDITSFSNARMKRATNKVIIDVIDDIVDCRVKHKAPLRQRMQIVLQDQYTTLPARKSVGKILSETTKSHGNVSKDQMPGYVTNLMNKCKLEDCYKKLPSEFSARELQKICIAKALTSNPKLMIYDAPAIEEGPASSEETVKLLKDIQDSTRLSYVYISQSPENVKAISDKVGVMYRGSMLELGSRNDIFENPIHPYTKALITNTLPTTAPADDTLPPADPTRGCKFYASCPSASVKCKYVTPIYREYERGHFAACHLCEGEIV